MKAPLIRPEDRLVAGVCSGLAGHLGWSVNLVRALMVLLAVSGGAGLVLYAWLWILVPTAGEAAENADAGRNPRSVAQNFTGHLSGNPVPGRPSTKRGWIEAAAGRDVLAGLALLAVAAVFIAQRFGPTSTGGSSSPSAPLWPAPFWPGPSLMRPAGQDCSAVPAPTGGPASCAWRRDCCWLL